MKKIGKIKKNLLSTSSGIKVFDMGPIFSAVRESNDEVIVDFVNNKPEFINNTNQTGDTLLHEASRLGNIPITKLLLHNSADPSMRNGERWTALHYAVVNGFDDICEQLLKFNSDINQKNSVGLNSFHLAAFTGHHTIVDFFFGFKSLDINELTDTGWTALHLAASENHGKVVQLLLDNSANPNSFKLPHGTPLHLAARKDYWQTVIVLLNAGASTSMKDGSGRSPLQVAPNGSRVRNILEKAKEEGRIRRGTIAPEVFLQQPNLTEEEEENILEQLQDQLFADIDQFVEETRKVQYEEFRASFKFGKAGPQNTSDPNLSEEARATKKIRNSSVISEFKGIEDLAPPISAWEHSGLQEISDSVESAVAVPEVVEVELSDQPLEVQQKEKEEKGLSDESKRVSVLLSVGFTEPATIAFAYPGADKIVQSSNMLWSWLSRVAGVIIDKQAQESMEHILRLLNTLFHDKNSKRSVNAMFSLTTLILYHNLTPFRSEVVVEDNNFIDSTLHYFKFACAAYGWKMLNPIMFSSKRKAVLVKGVYHGDKMNEQALCEHTGIAQEDIILAKWTSSDYNPAHYMCIDHSTQSIIIAIRGSFHIKDALIDLIACATPFQGGFAHLGMLECAKRKLDLIREPLLDLITQEKYQEYQLVVIGHSLGAGTASLLTLLLRELLPQKIRIHCHAFAPPCVLSPNLALLHTELITSYILGSDCVPRLSYASVQYLKELTTKLMDQAPKGYKVLLKAKRGEIDIDKIKQSIPYNIDNTLLPPGKCFHIVKENLDSTNSAFLDQNTVKKCFRIEQSSPTFYTEVIVCASMFSDHVPWNYNLAFDGVAERQKLKIVAQTKAKNPLAVSQVLTPNK